MKIVGDRLRRHPNQILRPGKLDKGLAEMLNEEDYAVYIVVSLNTFTINSAT